MYEALQQHQSVNIRQISDNRAEQVGYYRFLMQSLMGETPKTALHRFLENENVTGSELVQSIAEHCQQNVAERHVLAISDSSEINLQSHIGRLKSEGLGVVGNNTDVGFYIHPTLVVDSESGFPLGLSSIQLWTRDLDHQDKEERNYKKLPIEEKESYKWLASAERSQRFLVAGGAKMVTHIGDRESDLYEEWATVPDGYNHLLVRVCQDPRLFDRRTSLYRYLRQQPVAGTYTIDVPADKRVPRVARKAWLKVRFGQVKIRRPVALKAFDSPESVTLHTVEVEEIAPPQRPPGMPTLVRGLKRFESIFLGWKLSQYQLLCIR